MAAVGEVLPLHQQALVSLAGEQGDAVDPAWLPKPMTSHAEPCELRVGAAGLLHQERGQCSQAVIACG